MPLLDHFHVPMSEEAPWESFNTLWVGTLVGFLNRTLPLDRYRALASRLLGPEIEADVAEFENIEAGSSNGPAGNVAVERLAPPVTATIATRFPDDIAVHVVDVRGSRRLVAVIELMSPGNKKETSERRAFTAKCAAYLQKGIGLVVMDVVTERRANLHNELMAFLGQQGTCLFPPDTAIYAVALGPTRRDGDSLIDLWLHPLTVGKALPSLPLPLKGAAPVMLDLDTTYADACRASGL